MGSLKILFAALISAIAFFGCTSTTILKASSPKAKIYADGKYLGEGEVSYSDKKVVGSKTAIEIKAEGFKDQTTFITRNGSVNPGVIVGGILLAPTVIGLVLFLWVMDYDNHYAFALETAAKS